MPRPARWLRAASCLIAALALADALACNESAPRSDGFQGRQFEWDNDAFARTDRWFTNALRVSWVYCERPQQEAPITTALLRTVPFLLGEAAQRPSDRGRPARGVAYSVGQTMYTPQDITRAESQVTDRPWAGFLYVATGVFGYSGPVYHATDLKLGISGPHSKADWVQRQWHQLIDSDYPAGWEQQTRTRLGVQLGHMRLKRFGDTSENDRFGFSQGWAVNVGTLRSYATWMGGITLGTQTGPNPVFALSNEGDLVVQDFDNRKALDKWLFFANLSVTRQFTHHLITGRTLGPRPQVELRPWVVATQLGVSSPAWKDPFGGWLWDGRLRVIYSLTQRSADFHSPLRPERKAAQRWGTVSLNWDLK
jgi:lipid A 3-O-deacylase